MTNLQLKKRLARLESEHDYLQQEIRYLDALMRLIGFSGGLATVKAAAYTIIDHGYHLDDSGKLEGSDSDIV